MNNELEKEVSTLKINKKIVAELKEKEIKTIYDLCMLSRVDLKNLGIDNYAINEIIVALQLLGLDLKRNQSKKNTSVSTYMNKLTGTKRVKKQ